jgi:hypothetical protein
MQLCSSGAAGDGVTGRPGCLREPGSMATSAVYSSQEQCSIASNIMFCVDSNRAKLPAVPRLLSQSQLGQDSAVCEP